MITWLSHQIKRYTSHKQFDDIALDQYTDELNDLTQEDLWVKQYSEAVEALDGKLSLLGGRAFYTEQEDYCILDDWYGPHRALGLSLVSPRMLSSHTIPLIMSFIKHFHTEYMVNMCIEIDKDVLDFPDASFVITSDCVHYLAISEEDNQAIINTFGLFVN